MFNKLFKPKAIDFVAPMSGKLIPLEQVQDEAFSSKAIGDGLAIELDSNQIVSPVDGVVTMIFPTFHAIGIKGNDRNEYLIHVGMDTVNLKGEGFKCLVSIDQAVKKNETLMEVDLEFFKQKNVCMVSPVIVTNLNGRSVHVLKEGHIKAGEDQLLAIKN